MDEIRERHKDAITRFSDNYEPDGMFGLPHLKIGCQGFGLYFKRDDDNPEEEAAYREWLGIMACAALANLVDEHTATLTAERDALRAEVAQLREATNQCRLAFGGMVSVQSAIDMLDTMTRREPST